jgi:hypothetical protein
MSEVKGARNAYTCDVCKATIITINADEGTTPMLLDCAVTADCKGMMQSHWYIDIPAGEPTHEWYRPTARQLLATAQAEGWSHRGRVETAEHVKRGGLIIRKRTLEPAPAGNGDAAMSLADIWTNFKATTCLCGRKKIEKQSFCKRCYLTLDPQKRYALYKRFGEGYEEAFEVAIAELRAAGRIAPADPAPASAPGDETLPGRYRFV